MKIEIEYDLEMPRMPNFLRIKGTDKMIAIEELSEDFARIVAESLVDEFMNHYKKRRSQPPQSRGE